LVHLERLRLADAEPLAVDRVWLPELLAAPLLDVDFSRTGLYAEYAQRCGVRVSGGSERIRAAVPDDAERALLAIPAGVAVLAVDRLGLAGDQPVEWRQTRVRADRFSVTASFSTRDGYRMDPAQRVGPPALRS
jgi:GntR family transcriptional regulator